ncbi:tetraacyldisaccharide 4'-kinase [Acidovorax sp. Root70]|uniref:tetraacyldisaccharide 4'-kinase n=1 Tax=Acidovorax sp. Root70 TaxID=1736590 RepID=UPI0009E7369C|nr:tetraacyldisaccharide 4'-kinase [Acidovorax sp. Root70]
MAAFGPQPPRTSALQASPPKTEQRLQNIWQSRGPAAWALWPVSLLYGALVALRRWLYRRGWLRAEHPGRPVIVVGNVIAGGAGKTPVVIALVKHLQARGLRPGVISRGYGRSMQDCRAVQPDSPASEVGDEPALIARSVAGGGMVPVFVAPRRITAARALLAAYPDTDVIVCDDGLQHLALQRDLEICIFNDQGIGNGFLLPAGPLREPWPRAVDMVLHAGSAPPCGTTAPAFALQRSLAPYALQSDGRQVPLADLQGQPLHAVAAVARPGDFFAMLRAQGLTLERTEALSDHYNFDSWQRTSNKHLQLVCTEKDAVKLWSHHPDALTVPLAVRLAPSFFDALNGWLAQLVPGAETTKPPLSSPPA